MDFKTNKGKSLATLSNEKPLLLIFLRHFGCTFCRETMAEIAKNKLQIEATGVEAVLVHMVSSEVADEILSVYDLKGLQHISDPNQLLYRRFGLGKVSARAFFGIRNWYRAFIAGIVKGHLIGKPAGDPFQMPGVFLYHKGEIINTFGYKYISDMPNFAGMSAAVTA